MVKCKACGFETEYTYHSGIYAGEVCKSTSSCNQRMQEKRDALKQKGVKE